MIVTLPAPPDSIKVVMRVYLPQPQVLNGTWQPPGVEVATG
jgi:hypothetical protein